MKKALFINGSPRKNGNTAQLLKRAMEGAQEAGAEVELVNLYDRSLNYKGCTETILLGNHLYDELSERRGLSPDELPCAHGHFRPATWCVRSHGDTMFV